MKLYFDRTLPMFLAEDPTFDGHAVEVDDRIASLVLLLGDAISAVYLKIDLAGAPEDTAQELADGFMGYVNEALEELGYVKKTISN